MPIQPLVLWTDALLFVLVAGIAAFALYARRHEHLRAPWRQVKRRPLAMSALMVLVAYAVIGILDSIHFRVHDPLASTAGAMRYSTEAVSVLDKIVMPLRTRVETTYSAPFALFAHSKEFVDHPDGGRGLEYPRLRYGGAHLESADARAADIGRRAAVAVVEAVVFTVVVIALVAGVWIRRGGESFGAALRRFARGDTETPWRTMLATVGAIALAVTLARQLSTVYHVFGTDQVGQDVFLTAVKSIRTGLVIGTLTTLIMLPFALLFGIMAGYFRGWVDDVIQYIYTTLSSIPGVLLIAAAVLSLDVYMSTHAEAFTDLLERQDMRLLFLCLILGVTSWTGLCRLLRGESLKLREVDYIQAATALGVGHGHIMTRHILPNVMHVVLITVVLDFSGLVLAEAVLSYIGVGVDPSMSSWGNMINGARLEMAREPMVWWTLAAAFVFMFVLVLAANLFADAVRDAFDPRLRTA